MSAILQIMAGGMLFGQAVDPDFSNVSLLLHGNGTNGSTSIIDSSSFARTVTPIGNTQISTAQSKFGGSSIYFGAADYLAFSDTFNPSLGNWTFETWIYPENNSFAIISAANDFYLFSADGLNGQWCLGDGVTNIIQYTPHSVTINAWNHIALVKNGSVYTIYVNGVQSASSNVLMRSVNISSFQIGSAYVNRLNRSLTGYLDEFRYSNVARYTSNFTPPTSAFLHGAPPSGNTYATWNPADKSTQVSLSNSNLTVTSAATNWKGVRSTISKSTGKWYWECTMYTVSNIMTGISSINRNVYSYPDAPNTATELYNIGTVYQPGNGYSFAINHGDVIGVALDADAGTITFYKNGTAGSTISVGTTASPYYASCSPYDSGLTANFGATPFIYSVPSGYNAGLYV